MGDAYRRARSCLVCVWGKEAAERVCLAGDKWRKTALGLLWLAASWPLVCSVQSAASSVQQMVYTALQTVCSARSRMQVCTHCHPVQPKTVCRCAVHSRRPRLPSGLDTLKSLRTLDSTWPDSCSVARQTPPRASRRHNLRLPGPNWPTEIDRENRTRFEECSNTRQCST